MWNTIDLQKILNLSPIRRNSLLNSIHDQSWLFDATNGWTILALSDLSQFIQFSKIWTKYVKKVDTIVNVCLTEIHWS